MPKAAGGNKDGPVDGKVGLRERRDGNVEDVGGRFVGAALAALSSLFAVMVALASGLGVAVDGVADPLLRACWA